MRRAALAGACGALLALGGCAGLPSGGVGRQAALDRDRVVSFHLSGRVAVRRADQGWHAGLEWKHAQQSDDLELLSPLGQTMAHLSRDAEGATLVSSDGKTRADDIDTLGAEVFGEAVPLSSVARWVLARPQAGASIQRDAQGRPAAWTETGWAIRVAGYEDDRAEAMPQLIVAERGDLNIRLRVDRWEASAAEHRQ